MIALLVLAGIVALLFMRGRHKRTAARTDGLLISRDDRTASFARGPRRLRQRGHLSLPIIPPVILAPAPFHAAVSDPLGGSVAQLALLAVGAYVVIGLVVIVIRRRQDR